MPLNDIYREALDLCDPAFLVGDRVLRSSEREWLHRPCIILGKAAARLAAGLAKGGSAGQMFALVPSEYADSGTFPGSTHVVFGAHPVPDRSSFEAGATLLEWAGLLREPATVLLSGGASASVEAPLEPHFSRRDVAELHRLLLRSGLPIEQMNVARKHVSAIKGGRLARLLPAGSRCWILSDVTPGREDAVGSGPTFADPSTNDDAAAIVEGLDGAFASRIASRLRSGSVPDTPREGTLQWEVLADNDTLVLAAVSAAERRNLRATRLKGQRDGDVSAVAAELIEEVAALGRGEVLVAGGEPTVRVVGEGRGGRCSELAARLLERAAETGAAPFRALVGSSDGRDGNSGAAGYEVEWTGECRWTDGDIEGALARSDAHALLEKIGEPIIMGPTGNNLRDLIMMARP